MVFTCPPNPVVPQGRPVKPDALRLEEVVRLWARGLRVGAVCAGASCLLVTLVDWLG